MHSGVEKVSVETAASTIGIGKSFDLMCVWKVIDGVSPEVIVSWTAPPLLDESRTLYSGDFNETLHISEAELSDSGTYVCTVSGPSVTPISSSIPILVEGMFACECAYVQML